jgi:hypothetical protein
MRNDVQTVSIVLFTVLFLTYLFKNCPILGYLQNILSRPDRLYSGPYLTISFFNFCRGIAVQKRAFGAFAAMNPNRGCFAYVSPDRRPTAMVCKAQDGGWPKVFHPCVKGMDHKEEDFNVNDFAHVLSNHVAAGPFEQVRISATILPAGLVFAWICLTTELSFCSPEPARFAGSPNRLVGMRNECEDAGTSLSQVTLV